MELSVTSVESADYNTDQLGLSIVIIVIVVITVAIFDACVLNYKSSKAFKSDR